MEIWYSIPGFDQPMSSISHLSGAIIFALLSYYLLQPVWHDRSKFRHLAVFAASAVILLSLSSTFHMFAPNGIARSVMLRLDVAAIFLLIAGSFTPAHGILFQGWKRWGVLMPIWLTAITGITLRSIFVDRIPNSVGILIFLAMGWFGVVSVYLLWKDYGRQIAFPFVVGGMIYTTGAISELVRWPTIIPYVWGPHETFHYAVLGGLAFHWWAATLIAEGKLTRLGEKCQVSEGNADMRFSIAAENVAN